MHPQDIRAGQGALASLSQITRDKMAQSQAMQNAFNDFKHSVASISRDLIENARYKEAMAKDESRYQEALARDKQRYDESIAFRNKAYDEEKRRYEQDHALKSSAVKAQNAATYANARHTNTTSHAQAMNNAMFSTALHQTANDGINNGSLTEHEAHTLQTTASGKNHEGRYTRKNPQQPQGHGSSSIYLAQNDPNNPTTRF